jgi:hypothetical protein
LLQDSNLLLVRHLLLQLLALLRQHLLLLLCQCLLLLLDSAYAILQQARVAAPKLLLSCCRCRACRCC